MYKIEIVIKNSEEKFSEPLKGLGTILNSFLTMLKILGLDVEGIVYTDCEVK